MTGLVFVGPFLTRAQAARRAGLSSHDVALRPDLLRLRGRWLQETYFAFQFDERGIRQDLSRVVLALKSRYNDEAIADWLARPNPQLTGYSPVERPRSATSTHLILEAAKAAGPSTGTPRRADATGGSVAEAPRPLARPAPTARLVPSG